MEATETEGTGGAGSAQLGNRDHRLRSRLSFVLLCFVLALQIAIIVVALWQFKSIKGRLDDLEFINAVNDYNGRADFVTPDVGVIQFLRHGRSIVYSMVFDSATYTQEGLVLSGTVGNPTELMIGELTLNVSVRPFPSQVREKWNQKRFLFRHPETFEVGHAQVSIGLLPRGSTEKFAVTIPNVKQTPEKFQIAVWFSGERYAYR